MSSKTGHLFIYIAIKQASLVAQTEKNLPAKQADAGLILESWKRPWRRKWQPTSVFLPGKAHGQRSRQAIVTEELNMT